MWTAANLKAAARRGNDAYLRTEDAILSVLFFAGIVVMNILIPIVIAERRAETVVFPISAVFLNSRQGLIQRER
jgi:hypothetical protein